MRALYNAAEDARGEIAIAATPEEWQDIISHINSAIWMKPAAEDLVHWLINQGVYE